jgi:hypothetical protein
LSGCRGWPFDRVALLRRNPKQSRATKACQFEKPSTAFNTFWYGAAGAATKTTESLWERVIEPEENEMTAEAACYLRTLKFPAADIDRMNEPSAKAREGTLTTDEDDELETYIRVGNRLSILKSKARQYLAQTPK